MYRTTFTNVKYQDLCATIILSQIEDLQNQKQSKIFVPHNLIGFCKQIKQTYKPYTLMGPTVTRPVQDPLAVLRLENLLYMYITFTQMTVMVCQ